MRLLNTTDLTLSEFSGYKVPQYAILSHRWGKDEVSYLEMRCLTEPDERRRKILEVLNDVPAAKAQGQGFQKIKRICARAAQDNFEWIWIDTCCINKESSTELSEAINSMFKWYGDSSMCYAHLYDVRLSNGRLEEEDFKQSDWFRRGWTLQELLAPPSLLFLDANFEAIALKNDLEESISAATGIPRLCVLGQKSILTESIAARMSWAGNRTTTRKEDLAYCLLGIFNVNLPLLYGEGSKAFQRLQHEIIRSSDDETIFAHSLTRFAVPRDALSRHPEDFLLSSDVVPGVPVRFGRTSIGSTPYTITNKGIQMRVASVPIGRHLRGVVLNCHVESKDWPMMMAARHVNRPLHERFRFEPLSWHKDALETAKNLIDQALQQGRDPFEYDTIYLQ